MKKGKKGLSEELLDEHNQPTGGGLDEDNRSDSPRTDTSGDSGGSYHAVGDEEQNKPPQQEEGTFRKLMGKLGKAVASITSSKEPKKTWIDEDSPEGAKAFETEKDQHPENRGTYTPPQYPSDTDGETDDDEAQPKYPGRK